MLRPILRRACARGCPDCPPGRGLPGRAPVFAARPELARAPARAMRRRSLRAETRNGSSRTKVGSDLGVYAQQVREGLRRPAAEAAFGGDAEIARVFRRGGDARSRALDSVRVVHQPEEELRLATRFQPEKRGEIGLVVAIQGNRHVNVSQRPVKPLDEPVVNLHHVGGALRLLPVAAAVAAVAKVHAELDVPWDAIAMEGQAL